MRKKNPVLEEEILTVSARLMRERGIGSFSLRSLSSELGISLGNLYTYYSSKDLILISILERKSDILVRMVSQINVTTLEEYIKALSDAFREQYTSETGPMMASIGHHDREAVRKMNRVLDTLDVVISDALQGYGVTEDSLFRASFIRRNIFDSIRYNLDMDKTIELLVSAMR